MRKKLALRDVARIAGVSPKTVSRVINNEAGVLPATKEKVQQCIEKLGYTPNLHARSMRAASPRTVAVLYQEDLFSCYSNFLQRAFRDTAKQMNVEVIFRPVTRSDYQCFDTILGQLADIYSVGRVVLCPVLSRLPEIRYSLKTLAIPYELLAPEAAISAYLSLGRARQQTLTAACELLSGKRHHKILIVDASEGDRRYLQGRIEGIYHDSWSEGKSLELSYIQSDKLLNSRAGLLASFNEVTAWVVNGAEAVNRLLAKVNSEGDYIPFKCSLLACLSPSEISKVNPDISAFVFGFETLALTTLTCLLNPQQFLLPSECKDYHYREANTVGEIKMTEDTNTQLLKHSI